VPYTRHVRGRVWAVYTTRPLYVYTTRVHDCVRAVCTDVFGRVHGGYTAPYTGRVHGHVRAVHTSRIRPRTCVYVSTCTRAVYTAVYGPSTRPKTDVNTAVHGGVTCRVYGRVRAVSPRVHGHVRAVHTSRIRPRTCVYVSTCTRAVSTAVYGPSTRPKTDVYTAVHGGVTCRVYGRVRAVSPRVHGSVRPVCTAVFGRVH